MTTQGGKVYVYKFIHFMLHAYDISWTNPKGPATEPYEKRAEKQHTWYGVGTSVQSGPDPEGYEPANPGVLRPRGDARGSPASPPDRRGPC